MKPPLICVLLAALALAGCGKPSEQSQAPAVAAATEANLPPDAAGAAPVFSASEAGVGPLTETTPFNRNAIAELFPVSEVKAAYISEEGMQTPIVTINGPEALVLEVQAATSPGRVGRILVQGGPIAGPRGEKLLDRWPALGFKPEQCVMGADRFSSALLCRRTANDSLAFVFGIPGFVATGDEVPAEALLSEKAFLREFLWQAPQPR